jgi:hypothetical protein
VGIKHQAPRKIPLALESQHGSCLGWCQPEEAWHAPLRRRKHHGTHQLMELSDMDGRKDGLGRGPTCGVVAGRTVSLYRGATRRPCSRQCQTLHENHLGRERAHDPRRIPSHQGIVHLAMMRHHHVVALLAAFLACFA